MLEEFQLEQIVKPLLAWFEKNGLGVGDHAAADPCGGSETIF